nr:hypothetical protein [Tanacetum cinerariifolium]
MSVKERLFPIVSGLEVGQDKENIIKTSALPHDSIPRVTSLAADEGSMQQQLNELMNLCTRLQRQQTEMASKIAAQDLEISNLNTQIKMLEDKDGGGAEPSGEDATIKDRSLETGEETGVEKSTEKGSNDTEGLVNVLTSLDAANILTSGVQVVSVPPAVEVSTVGIPTGSGMVPTASPISTTASVVTPYSRRKAREMEEQMDREDHRRNEQIVRDAEITRIHAEEELQMLIDGLDRNNEIIAKYLQEYEQATAELTIGEKIELINTLVKYQDHHSKILKVNSPSFSGQTVPLFDSMLVTQGEGLGTPTDPHHAPSPEAQQSPHNAPSSPSLPPATTETIITSTPTEIPTLRGCQSRRGFFRLSLA